LTSVADVVHVSFGAAWFGGLVMLGCVLRRRDDADPAAGGRTVARFSNLATVSVLAIGAAGFALGWAEVRSIDALTSTTYGKLLMAKVAIVAAIAATGAYNHLVLVPAVTRQTSATVAWHRLRRTVGMETAAMVCAIGLTGVLVNVTPAVAAVTGPYTTTAELGDGSVQVVVDPARTGFTSLHLYLLDATGSPTDLATGGLTLELALPSADLGPIARTPLKAGPGHFQLDGDDFAIAGRWQITVRATVSRFEDQTATVEVPIRP
jgi:copper transport protein